MVEAKEVGGLEGLAAKAKCIECGYLLRGLVVARCPECGTGFDPGDATTYVTQPVLGWVASVALVTAALVNGFIIIGGILGGVRGFFEVFLAPSLNALLLDFTIDFLLVGFGLVNFLSLRDQVERLGHPWCRVAVAVNVLSILVAAGLTVLAGGVITFFSLLLVVIPAGNILTLMVIKER